MRLIDQIAAVHGTAEFQTEWDRRLLAILFDGPMEHCFEQLGCLAGFTVVEIGCGNGVLSVACALAGAFVLGLDIESVDLAKARRLARRWRVADRCWFINSRTEAMALGNASADIVLSRSTLQYLDRLRVAEELARVLRPGGRIALMENLPFNPFINLFRWWRARQARNTEDFVYLESIRGYLTRGEIASWRREFLDLRTRAFYLFRMFTILPVVAHPTIGIWRVIDRGVARLDALLLRCFPILARFAWFTTILGQRPKELSSPTLHKYPWIEGDRG